MEPAAMSPLSTTITATPQPATHFSRRDISVSKSTAGADVRQRTWRSSIALAGAKAFGADHAGTLADDHQLADSHFGNFFDRSVGPANLQAGRGRGAQPEMQPAIVDGKIRGLGEHCLHLPALPIRGHHLGANRTTVGGNANQQDLQPVIRPGDVIAQQRRRLVEIDNQNVDVAVVIEIAESHSPAAMRLGDAGPRQTAQFFEFAVSQIAKNHAGRLVGGIRRLPLHFGIDHAGGEEEVGKSVVVQVHDAGAPTDVPGLHAEARADGYVAEIDRKSTRLNSSHLPNTTLFRSVVKKRSGSPSLSRSTMPAPQQTYRVSTPRPARMVTSRKERSEERRVGKECRTRRSPPH